MKWVFAKDVSIGLQFARSDMVTARSEAKRVVQTQNGKTGMWVTFPMWSQVCHVLWMSRPTQSGELERRHPFLLHPPILGTFCSSLTPGTIFWLQRREEIGSVEMPGKKCINLSNQDDTPGSWRLSRRMSKVKSFKILVVFQSVSGINWGEGERKRKELPERSVTCCYLDHQALTK